MWSFSFSGWVLVIQRESGSQRRERSVPRSIATESAGVFGHCIAYLPRLWLMTAVI